MDFGKFDPPISPELALVDPELAKYARSLLPPIDLDAPTPAVPEVVEAGTGPVLVPPADRRRRRKTKRGVGLMLAAALAVGVAAALTITMSRRDGSSGPQTARQAAGGFVPSGTPARTSAPRVAARGGATARVDGARKTVVSPAPEITHRRTASTSQPTKPATRPARTPVGKAHSASATHRRTPPLHQTPLLRRTPLLSWPSSPTARFFDVVLWRGGTRLLDSWPSIPRLQVPSSWTYGGHHYRLSPGTYLWFVYPGLGSRLQPRYGPLLKSGQFTIASPAAN